MDAKALQDDLQSLGFTPSLAKPEIGKEVGRRRACSSIYIKLKVCLSVCLSAIERKLETFRYKQTYESYITFSREAKYSILISIRIVFGGLRAYIYFPSFYILPDQRRVNLYLFSFSLHFTRSRTGGNGGLQACIYSTYINSHNKIQKNLITNHKQNVRKVYI